MSFAVLKTRKVLVAVDMLPKYFYSDNELSWIRNTPTFGGWSQLGYYEETTVPIVIDRTAYSTFHSDARSENDYLTLDDYYHIPEVEPLKVIFGF